jgi:hypothetical protein
MSFCSFSLTPEQRRYCTTGKELLAVVLFTRHFRCFLPGLNFDLYTDHNSLQWLVNFKNPTGQLERWLEVLSKHWIDIHHRSSNKHLTADFLSRLQEDDTCQAYKHAVEPEELPCGGCLHYKKKIITNVTSSLTLSTTLFL